MAVSLQKGGNVSLSKEAPGLKDIVVGLGWNPRSTDGAKFDLDASVFILPESGKVASDKDFVFYGNLANEEGSVRHSGDNRTGDGDGDDETITIALDKLKDGTKRLVFSVTIHEAEEKKLNFGMVSDAYIRVLNAADGKVLARFDLSEDASTETAMNFGEVYLHNGEWKFKAVGQGFAGGLAPLATDFGVNVG